MKAVAVVEFTNDFDELIFKMKPLSAIRTLYFFAFSVKPNQTKVVLNMDDLMEYSKVKKTTALKNIEKLKDIGFLLKTSVSGVYFVNPKMSFRTYVVPPEPTAKQIEIWGEPDREWIEVDEDDLDWTMIEVINKHLIDVQLDLVNITN
jgi:hypothetical protein